MPFSLNVYKCQHFYTMHEKISLYRFVLGKNIIIYMMDS